MKLTTKVPMPEACSFEAIEPTCSAPYTSTFWVRKTSTRLSLAFKGCWFSFEIKDFN